MFVVRRAFKNYGEALLPGSVVEPGNIKNFKTRLRERVIIEVPEQDFEKWNNYFKAKFGVPIALPETSTDGTDGTEGTEGTDGTEGTEGTEGTDGTDGNETTPVKPVVKVTVTE